MSRALLHCDGAIIKHVGTYDIKCSIQTWIKLKIPQRFYTEKKEGIIHLLGYKN